MLPFVWQFLARPRWLAGFLFDGGLMRLPNVVRPDGPMAYADVGAALEQSVVSWPDLKWIREAWNGPVVVKGVLTAEDARRAVDEGVEAVVASNHGGRQLDGVAAEATKAEDFAAAEHFKKITEAYTVLSDPEKRALSTTATASRGARRKRRAARRHVRAPGRYRRVSRAASADAKMTSWSTPSAVSASLPLASSLSDWA